MYVFWTKLLGMQCMMSKCLSSKKWTKWKVEQWRIWQKKSKHCTLNINWEAVHYGAKSYMNSHLIFFFLFIHLRFHKLPSYYFRKSWAYFGTWHFGKRHFGTDISSRGFFSTRTFCHENISTLVYFGTMDNLEQECYSTGTFQHKDVSAHGHFGTCTFWNCAKGTFIKDVRQFWAILDIPTYPCPMFSILCLLP